MSVTHRNLLVAARVTVTLSGGGSFSAWGSPAAARSLRESIEGGVLAWAQKEKDRIEAATAIVREFLDADCYLTEHAVQGFRQRHEPLFTGQLQAARVLARRGDVGASDFLALAEDFAAVVARRNLKWSEDEQERWRGLLDIVEPTPLTAEQRKAVVDFENRNLLVAAAGSGKSATLVAKIAYAVRKRLFRPDEILALAFNDNAAKELAERIQRRLGDIPSHTEIHSKTFHGLGSKILNESRQKQIIDDDRRRRISEAYDRLKASDPAFRRDVVRFVLNFTPDLRDRTEFETFEEYREHLKNVEERGGAAGRRVPTLSGHHVASNEERKIANWLFTHGVRFEYEKTYPHVEATRERRGYMPDFYYPDIDAWHEHFGVDAQGRPAPCIGDATEYLTGMEWKRETHQAFGTTLMETTSAMFANESIFDELESALRARGQALRELTPEEIDAKLTKGAHNDFTELIATFIAHWKSSEIPFEVLMERGSVRDRAFLPICKRVFDEYGEALARDRRVDFDDLILGGTRALQTGAWQSPYRLILVDEFQDISTARAGLVRALLAQHPDAVLFCVGDDWQAINGFAGAQIAIMRNFEREFGRCVMNHLTRTFRSNQGISSAAKAFVERNPAQLRKEVVAHDKNANDCLRIVRYRSRQELPAAYEAIARELAGAGRCTLKVLGRYRKNKDPANLEVFERLAPNVEVEFKTMHGSKGLQADYVILDSVESRGKFAFPSTITDDSVLRLVMPEREPFPHAEERRLMYVALTRAKHRVFILTLEERESPFVLELERGGSRSTSASVYACPHCKNGTRVRREGKYGAFWSCSRFPECEGKVRRPVRRKAIDVL